MSDREREALTKIIKTYDDYRRRGVAPAPAEYADLVAAIDSARAALSAPQHSHEAWRPIETAPKDGGYFLAANQWGVWVCHYKSHAQSGYQFESPWRSVMLNHWHMGEDVRHNAATHWAPLPQQPESGT